MEERTLTLTYQQINAVYAATQHYYKTFPTSDPEFEKALLGRLKDALFNTNQQN